MKTFSDAEIALAHSLNKALLERKANEVVKQLILLMMELELKASADIVTLIPMYHRGDGVVPLPEPGKRK